MIRTKNLPKANAEEIRDGQESLRRHKARRSPIPFDVDGVDNKLIIEPNIDGKEAEVDIRLLDVFGSTDQRWRGHLINCLAAAKDSVDGVPQAVGAGLAFMNGLQPANEMEAALGAQMFVTHAMMMRMAYRAEQQKSLESISALYGQFNKLGRTYTAQIEALAKLRNGGKQTVNVTHTHIDARGSQNVIADTVTTGGGSADQTLTQSVAQVLGYEPGSPCASVRSEVEADRLPVQGASH